MMRTLVKLALGASLAILSSPSDVFAGRGGGRGGGGGGGRGGAQRGGAAMGRSPSFSQPRPAMNTARPQGNSGAAAGGAAYANRNQTAAHPAGAAAAGAGYANRNQTAAHPAGAAAAGAGYANHNQYDQYHPGMTNGYWNGNYGYGAWGMGAGLMAGVGMWGMGSALYGYGYSGYNNPYYGAGVGQAGLYAQSAGGPAYDYSQPINTQAAPPEQTTTDQATAVFDQAREAFRSNDYPTALARDEQALGQMPNDATLHEFLSLVLFAQGKYEPAAAPLYAVLSVGPGWDWTTLIGNYADANLYTTQLRALEAYVNANPKAAQARFVLAYHYITQGHGDAAAVQLKEVVALQPNDTLSAQLLGKLQPDAGTAAAPTSPPQSAQFDPAKLIGNWSAQNPQNAKITLSIKDGGGFTWAFTIPDKPPTSITGTSTVAGDVLSLASKDSQVGPLTGQVAWQDDAHFVFKATGAPADDPGLKFAR
jgi:tetratricopeptide (TPR) repeat protein